MGKLSHQTAAPLEKWQKNANPRIQKFLTLHNRKCQASAGQSTSVSYLLALIPTVS